MKNDMTDKKYSLIVGWVTFMIVILLFAMSIWVAHSTYNGGFWYQHGEMAVKIMLVFGFGGVLLSLTARTISYIRQSRLSKKEGNTSEKSR